jgi:hypothetical protein
MITKGQLELAATAAGFKSFIYREDIGEMWCDGHGVWCPWSDDGESLRLANQIGLTIGQTFDGAYVDLCAGEILQKMPIGGCQHEVKWSEFGGDKNAACRKAVLLCAAQIGKAMLAERAK